MPVRKSGRVGATGVPAARGTGVVAVPRAACPVSLVPAPPPPPGYGTARVHGWKPMVPNHPGFDASAEADKSFDARQNFG